MKENYGCSQRVVENEKFNWNLKSARDNNATNKASKRHHTLDAFPQIDFPYSHVQSAIHSTANI